MNIEMKAGKNTFRAKVTMQGYTVTVRGSWKQTERARLRFRQTNPEGKTMIEASINGYVREDALDIFSSAVRNILNVLLPEVVRGSSSEEEAGALMQAFRQVMAGYASQTLTGTFVQKGGATRVVPFAVTAEPHAETAHPDDGDGGTK